MAEKKPWTVMVYMAADNNLTNFGVDSLKQMKAVGGNQVNIVAEFDSGPSRLTRRYLFDGGTRFGSISQNELPEIGPVNTGNPRNLTAFIEWTAAHFPAQRYFVIIWGHGGGIDDAFPQQPNRAFVRRHRLLNLAKGVLDAPQMGVLDAPRFGALDESQSDFQGPSGTIVSGAVEEGVLEELHKFVINLLREGVLSALQNYVLQALASMDTELQGNNKQHDAKIQGQHPGLPDQILETVKDVVLKALKQKTQEVLKGGNLDDLQRRIISAMHEGAIKALQGGILLELQTEVIAAVRRNDLNLCKERTEELLEKRLLPAFMDGVVEALQENLFAPSNDIPSGKSIAFVDHPESFLTNQDLRDALENAKSILGKKIDILGLDSCNMAMLELGYELRHCVRYLVASQASIPDASWPYDQILAQLMHSPNLLPRDLAEVTASTYVSAYEDYIGELVTLSGLDLERFQSDPPGKEPLLDLIKELGRELKAGLKDFKIAELIANVRAEVQGFGQNEFVDLVDLCKLLANSLGSTLSSASITSTNIQKALRDIVAFNHVSNEDRLRKDDQTRNGVSIYFPQFNPSRDDHLVRLEEIYRKLEFNKTEWGAFVSSFLDQQRAKSAANAAARGARQRVQGKQGSSSKGTQSKSDAYDTNPVRAKDPIPVHIKYDAQKGSTLVELSLLLINGSNGNG